MEWGAVRLLVGSKSQVEEAQTGAFRLDSGIRSLDAVVQRWCGLKWASWQASSKDTMATHIPRLQREEKYLYSKSLFMTYLQSVHPWRPPNATVRGAMNASSPS